MDSKGAYITGFLSGIVEALSFSPFQVIKVRLQTTALNTIYKNSHACLKHIYKTEGILFFTIGLKATMIKNTG